MLYYLFNTLGIGGEMLARLSSYITVRASVAFVLSLLCAMIFGRMIINRLQLMQMGEIVRELGLEGQTKKKGTPTMGGIIIILSIMLPCLIIGNMCNIYMVLMCVTTIWLGALGFLDDYLKFKKKSKDGLAGKYKIVGQFAIGLMVGLAMVYSPDIVVRQGDMDVHQAVTTIPFIKDNNFDYMWLTQWMGNWAVPAGWIIFVVIVTCAVIATSNGANLTDGIDGLATGVSAIIGVALIIMAYLGANVIYATYLNIMYLPGTEELVVYMAAFIGALIGFLWYNAFPAQVFMGDTGSLTLGGIIAVFAVLIRKELLIPVLCAVFFIEDISVVIQTLYFKHTKKKFGGDESKAVRVFKMTPIHHHFQKDANPDAKVIWNKPKNGMHEAKITIRFWIVSILLAALTFVTLKIR